MVSVVLDHLEQFKGLNQFCGFPSEIPCFSENVVTGTISLRVRYGSYIHVGIFIPLGTISEVFEKNSSFFPESAVVLAFLQFSGL